MAQLAAQGAALAAMVAQLEAQLAAVNARIAQLEAGATCATCIYARHRQDGAVQCTALPGLERIILAASCPMGRPSP